MLIEAYEQKHWNNPKSVTSRQLQDSESAERTAEFGRTFFEKRKSIIRKKLKEHELNQEELGRILGHKSKTHMSELMNGIKPFTLPDLVAINLILKINLNELIPVFISAEKKQQIRSALIKLNKPMLVRATW